MTNDDLQDRVRTLGHSDHAPALPVGRIVAEGRARKARRRTWATAGVALVLIAGAGVFWAVAGQQATNDNRGVTATTSTRSTPPPIGFAPLCAPAGPVLRDGPSASASALTQPIAAKAGGQVTLWATVAPNRPDRQLKAVQFIVAMPGIKADLEGTATPVLQPQNQVSSVLVPAPGSEITVTLELPATTRPGSYPLFAYSTWPAPSLCGGFLNDPTSTAVGVSLGQVGTITVSSN